MTKHEAIKVFEERKVRTVWDDQGEKWYFSIVDVIAVLTDSPKSEKILERPENPTEKGRKRVGYKL
jgi:maltooligosyltrehalose synthase